CGDGVRARDRRRRAHHTTAHRGGVAAHPGGHRSARYAGQRGPRVTGLHTRICDLFGVRYPIVQTGMGYVSGPSLVSATANAGGLGIIAGATLSFEELQGAIRAVRDRTGEPFGVNLRSDAPDAAERANLLIKEGVKVASFALAPKPELIAKLKDAGVVVV